MEAPKRQVPGTSLQLQPIFLLVAPVELALFYPICLLLCPQYHSPRKRKTYLDKTRVSPSSQLHSCTLEVHLTVKSQAKDSGFCPKLGSRTTRDAVNIFTVFFLTWPFFVADVIGR